LKIQREKKQLLSFLNLALVNLKEYNLLFTNLNLNPDLNEKKEKDKEKEKTEFLELIKKYQNEAEN